ncbi:LigA [Gracilaria domingensis]|nr:LigA [Gracilaria domingensis]
MRGLFPLVWASVGKLNAETHAPGHVHHAAMPCDSVHQVHSTVVVQSFEEGHDALQLFGAHVGQQPPLHVSEHTPVAAWPVPHEVQAGGNFGIAAMFLNGIDEIHAARLAQLAARGHQTGVAILGGEGEQLRMQDSRVVPVAVRALGLGGGRRHEPDAARHGGDAAVDSQRVEQVGALRLDEMALQRHMAVAVLARKGAQLRLKVSPQPPVVLGAAAAALARRRLRSGRGARREALRVRGARQRRQRRGRGARRARVAKRGQHALAALPARRQQAQLGGDGGEAARRGDARQQVGAARGAQLRRGRHDARRERARAHQRAQLRAHVLQVVEAAAAAAARRAQPGARGGGRKAAVALHGAQQVDAARGAQLRGGGHGAGQRALLRERAQRQRQVAPVAPVVARLLGGGGGGGGGARARDGRRKREHDATARARDRGRVPPARRSRPPPPAAAAAAAAASATCAAARAAHARQRRSAGAARMTRSAHTCGGRGARWKRRARGGTGARAPARADATARARDGKPYAGGAPLAQGARRA